VLFRHSSRRRPLNNSMCALWLGLPARQAAATPASHVPRSSIARPRKLSTIVGMNGFGVAATFLDPIENTHHLTTSDAEDSRNVVHYRETFGHTATGNPIEVNVL